MADIDKVREGLIHHLNRQCAGCPYSDKPDGCLIEALLPDVLETIDENRELHEHVDKLHGGIEALRDAMMGR